MGSSIIIGHSSHPGLEQYTDAAKGTRVVLAEDDIDLRNLLCEALRRANFAPLAARDGREVLAMFGAISNKNIPAPDVIVLDVRMPSHSGLELLVALKRADWHIPVVLMTGFGDELMHQKALEYGAFALLNKPMSAHMLVYAVRRAAQEFQDHAVTVDPAKPRMTYLARHMKEAADQERAARRESGEGDLY